LDIQDSFLFDIKIVENKITEGWQSFAVSNDLFILVRPDQHILYIADSLDKVAISKHLSNYFLTDK
jgi:hypothetical protein